MKRIHLDKNHNITTERFNRTSRGGYFYEKPVLSFTWFNLVLLLVLFCFWMTVLVL